VKPPDDATSTKTKEAAKRERTEEEIDADLALLQGVKLTQAESDPRMKSLSTCVDCGAANTLDPKKPGKINQCWSCGEKSEVEKVIGVCIADGKSDYGVEIGLSSKGYGEGLKHSQKGLISDRNRREGEVKSK
jgi:hypothetical protein